MTRSKNILKMQRRALQYWAWFYFFFDANILPSTTNEYWLILASLTTNNLARLWKTLLARSCSSMTGYYNFFSFFLFFFTWFELRDLGLIVSSHSNHAVCRGKQERKRKRSGGGCGRGQQHGRHSTSSRAGRTGLPQDTHGTQRLIIS